MDSCSIWVHAHRQKNLHEQVSETPSLAAAPAATVSALLDDEDDEDEEDEEDDNDREEDSVSDAIGDGDSALSARSAPLLGVSHEYKNPMERGNVTVNLLAVRRGRRRRAHQRCGGSVGRTSAECVHTAGICARLCTRLHAVPLVLHRSPCTPICTVALHPQTLCIG